MRHWNLVVLLFSFFLFTACEDDEQSKLVEAQACLDAATSATALNCSNLISSLTSEQAYVIKCSSRFLARGLDEGKIVAAIQELSSDNGTNPTSTAISNLAVMDDADNPTSYDTSFAQETLSTCNNSGSAGLSALASFSSIATSVGALVSAESCIDANPSNGEDYEVDVSCMQSQIGSAGDGDAASIGQTAVANQQALCGEDGAFKGEAFCTDLNAAIAAGGSNDEIGDAILNGIKGD